MYMLNKMIDNSKVYTSTCAFLTEVSQDLRNPSQKKKENHPL